MYINILLNMPRNGLVDHARWWPCCFYRKTWSLGAKASTDGVGRPKLLPYETMEVVPLCPWTFQFQYLLRRLLLLLLLLLFNLSRLDYFTFKTIDCWSAFLVINTVMKDVDLNWNDTRKLCTTMSQMHLPAICALIKICSLIISLYFFL